jgi:hypothetical protein
LKIIATAAAFALVAAACGGDSDGPLTLEEYAAEMESLSDDFFADRPDDNEGVGGEYPIGGDLVPATELYTAYDSLLSSWSALRPPESVADLHADLIRALDALQIKVGDYLMDEALQQGELQFQNIGRKVQQEIFGAAQVCRSLTSAIAQEGIDRRIFGDCEF